MPLPGTKPIYNDVRGSVAMGWKAGTICSRQAFLLSTQGGRLVTRQGVARYR